MRLIKKLNCFQLLHNFGGQCCSARKISPGGKQALLKLFSTRRNFLHGRSKNTKKFSFRVEKFRLVEIKRWLSALLQTGLDSSPVVSLINKICGERDQSLD